MIYICVSVVLKLEHKISDNSVTAVNSKPINERLNNAPPKNKTVFQNLLKVNNINLNPLDIIYLYESLLSYHNLYKLKACHYQ